VGRTPDRLLALTTEALAFFPETGLRAWRVNGWLAYLSRTATSNPCWKGRRRMTIDASCHNWFPLWGGGWLIPNGNNSLVWGFVCQALCGNDPRGARHWARSIAPRPCIRLDPCWIRTMKQSFASTARLRGGGPILPTASKPWSCSGHRHLGSSLTASRESAIGRQSYVFAFLDHQTALRLPPATERRSGFRRS